MVAVMTQPKAKKKLSRAQVQEILERNAQLHRSDENFVPYLVELALYLLEYEYDWTESGAEPPSDRPSTPSAAPGPAKSEKPLMGGSLLGSALKPIRPVTPPEVRPSSGLPANPPLPPPRLLRGGARTPAGRTCMHCGTQIGDELICPSCRNLTR